MSIYFQTTPAGIADKTTPAKGVAATHATEPLFGFASSPGGRILICNDEGDTVHEVTSSQSAAPSAMSFHPTRAIFAVGYRNGGFLLSGCGIENAYTNSALSHLDQRELPQIHQGGQVTAVAFGTSLVDEMTTSSGNNNNTNTNYNNILLQHQHTNMSNYSSNTNNSSTCQNSSKNGYFDDTPPEFNGLGSPSPLGSD